MGYFDFFSRNEEECPRCMGKGLVDEKDIKRLDRELFWEPGKCAYCLGTGKVSQKTIDNMPANLIALTIDMDLGERNRLLDGEPDAILNAMEFETRQINFIKEIEYLYFKADLKIEQIVAFYLIPFEGEDEAFLAEETENFSTYIHKVIEHADCGK